MQGAAEPCVSWLLGDGTDNKGEDIDQRQPQPPSTDTVGPGSKFTVAFGLLEQALAHDLAEVLENELHWRSKSTSVIRSKETARDT